MADQLFLDQVVAIHAELFKRLIEDASSAGQNSIIWEGTAYQVNGQYEYGLATKVQPIAEYAGTHPLTYKSVMTDLNEHGTKEVNFSSDQAVYIDRTLRRIFEENGYTITQLKANEPTFEVAW